MSLLRKHGDVLKGSLKLPVRRRERAQQETAGPARILSFVDGDNLLLRCSISRRASVVEEPLLANG